MVPHGPIRGCHVAPLLCKRRVEDSVGIELGTSTKQTIGLTIGPKLLH